MLQSTRRWFVVILSVFLLASFLASALITIDPEQLLAAATANNEKLKTVAISVNEDMDILDQQLNITMDGMIELPDKAYLELSTAGQSMQMLMLSQDEVYARLTDADAWEQIDMGTGVQSLGLNIDFLSQQKTMDLYKNAVYIDDQVVDGVNCYHLSYSVDFESYFSKLLSASASNMFTLESVESSGEIWIGKMDMLIHKNHMDATLNLGLTDPSYGIDSMDLKIAATVVFSHFNEPVTIPEP